MEFMPKELEQSKEFTAVATYDPAVTDELMKLVGSSEPGQELRITYPDGTVWAAQAQVTGCIQRTVPDSRWQAFKKRWFPRFLLRWFPVHEHDEVDVQFQVDPDTVHVVQETP